MNRFYVDFLMVIGLICFGIFYTQKSTPNVSEVALSGLKKQVYSETAKGKCRIAIGYNANLDLIVKAKDLLSALNIQPAGSSDHPSINSLSDFQEIFSHYLSMLLWERE